MVLLLLDAREANAVVALVGWTILELIVLWVVGIFRRRSVTASI